VYTDVAREIPDKRIRIEESPDESELDVHNVDYSVGAHESSSHLTTRLLIEAFTFEQIDDRFESIKPSLARTCKWLLTSAQFTDWLDPAKIHDHHGFFWIRGKPGCGKSTLTKFAFQHLKKMKTNGSTLSFFFNARGDKLEKSTIGLYRSLLVQLLNRYPQDLKWDFPSLLQNSSIDRIGANCELLKGLFREVLQRENRHDLTILIDALDECNEDDVRDMIRFFQDVATQAVDEQRPLRVFFSSRHYPYITIQPSRGIIVEDQIGHSKDIELYIKSELKVGGGSAVMIRMEMQQRASGIFMWVVLVVQILNKLYDRGQEHMLLEELSHIPSDLHRLLQSILLRDNEGLDKMKLCMQWILYSKRPMLPDELHHAILIGTSSGDEEPVVSDLPILDETNADMTERFIIYHSKGLAEITRTKIRRVQFIHESVRDFLLKVDGLGQIWSELSINPAGLSHDRLKQCCYNYMSLDITGYLQCPKDLPTASSPEGAELRKNASSKFPFLNYATLHLFVHADAAQGEGIDQTNFLEGFEFQAWIRINNMIERYEVRRLEPDIDRLYIFAEQKCSRLIDFAIQNNWARGGQGGRHGNPIFAAMANKSSYIFEALVKYDRERQPEGCVFPYPSNGVFSFLIKQTPDIIHLFLSTFQVDKHWTGRDGKTLLSWSVEERHDKIFELLVSKGANVNTQGDYDGVLLEASANGHDKIVELLLHHGADVNMQDGDNNNALQTALANGYDKIVELLLSKGANVNAQGGYYGNALQAASANGYDKIVEKLLSKGANINAQGGHYGNALQAASARDHNNIVELLLSRGANVNAQGGYYGNALQAASMRGCNETVEQLLSKGANLNAQGGVYGNALQAASMRGCNDVVEQLLSKGANINAQGGHYGNALQAASVRGHNEMVELLLSKGAYVNAQGGVDGNALQAASVRGYNEIVELLLSKGANVNAQGGKYGSALQAASSQGRNEIAQLLLSKSTD
jgi:ankyrin repeat protein